MKARSLFYWTVRLIAVVIMMQTLYFKFSGAEESVYIFTTVGMEPWGRIMIGVLELVASILILFNSTAWIGACLALGLMAGAIVMHLTTLGISVRNDGGQLFLYAVIVTICSALILFFNKEKITALVKSVFNQT